MAKPSQLSRIVGSIIGGSSDLSPNALASRRSAAEAELQEAERLHRKAALDAERGAPGAIAAKAEAVGTLRLAQERLRDVLAAQVEAEAERQERQRAERDASRAKQIREAEQHLAAQVPSIEAATAALVEVIKHLGAAVEHGEAAANVAPSGAFPRGSFLQGGKLDEAIRLEISRIGGVKFGWLFGGKYVRGHVFDPTAIMPLATKIKRDNAAAIKQAKQ